MKGRSVVIPVAPSFSFHRMNDFNLLVKYLYTECFFFMNYDPVRTLA